MGQFDAQQARIESIKKVKAPDKLKQTLNAKANILTGAVDQGEEVLSGAMKELKHPKSRAYITKASGEIRSILTNIASQGFSIIRDKKKLEAGVSTIEGLIGNLTTKLAEQVGKIGAYRSYETNLKLVEDFAEEVKKLKELRQKAFDLDKERSKAYSAKPPKTKEELAVIDAEYAAAAKPYIEAVRQVEETSSTYSDPNFYFSNDGEVSGLFAKLKTEKGQPAVDDLKSMSDGIESMEKDLNRVDARQELAAVQEMTLKLEVEMSQYVPIVEKLNPNWAKAEESEKNDCLSREKSLLMAYMSAKTSIETIYAGLESGDIYWMDKGDIAAIEKPVSDNIKRIESFKIERKMRETVGDDIKYVEFYTNDEGYRAFRENKDESVKIGTHEEHNSIYRNIKCKMSDARKDVFEETEDIKAEVMLSGGKKKRDVLEKRLGDKGKLFFDALKGLSTGDGKGANSAQKALKEYLAQDFSDEEKKLHAGVIKQAKEMLATLNEANDFYAAMSLSQSGDPKAAIDKFNAYLASVEKMSADKKEAHKGHIEGAKEAIRSIGLANVNMMTDIFDDVRKLREAQRRLAGAHLHYSESMEDQYFNEELNALRERISSGECRDPFKEIAEAKARIKKKVEEKVKDINWEYEESLLDEADKLFNAVNDQDPKVREKALVEFAKKCRDKRAYGLTRKYLEYALQPMYDKLMDNIDENKVRKTMLKDPKIYNWLKENAEKQYAKLKQGNNLGPLTYDDVFNRLVQYKMKDVVRSQIRHEMTLAGLSGEAYREQAKDDSYLSAFADIYLVTQRTTDIVSHAKLTGETNEALVLHNEWFKDVEKDSFLGFEYNPTQWGAADWDEFEDFCIEFAFDLATSWGMGAGARSVGTAVGKKMLKTMIKRGVPKATIKILEKGGWRAFKHAMRSRSKTVISGYLKRQAAIMAAEGAFMFASEAMLMGVKNPEAAAKMYNEWWKGPTRFGVAVAKSAAFRVLGSAGERFLGNNPALWKTVTEQLASGAAGEGIEYVSMAGISALDGEPVEYTSKDFVLGMIQDSFMAGGHRLGSRGDSPMTKRERAARKASTEHDLDTIGINDPGEIGKVRVVRTKQDGEVLVEYVVSGKNGTRRFSPADLECIDSRMAKSIDEMAGKTEPDGGPYRTAASVEKPAKKDSVPPDEAGTVGAVPGKVKPSPDEVGTAGAVPGKVQPPSEAETATRNVVAAEGGAKPISGTDDTLDAARPSLPEDEKVGRREQVQDYMEGRLELDAQTINLLVNNVEGMYYLEHIMSSPNLRVAADVDLNKVKQDLAQMQPEMKQVLLDRHVDELLATPEGVNKILADVNDGLLPLSPALYQKLILSDNGVAWLKSYMDQNSKAKLDARLKRDDMAVEVMWRDSKDREVLLNSVEEGSFPLNERIVNKMMKDPIGAMRLERMLEGGKIVVHPDVNAQNVLADIKFLDPASKNLLILEISMGKVELSDHIIRKMMAEDGDLNTLNTILATSTNVKISDDVGSMDALKTRVETEVVRREDKAKLSDLRKSNKDNFVEAVSDAVEAVKSGKEIDANDELGNILKRLSQHDEALFKALTEGDLEKIVKTEAFEAIVAGKTLEFKDTDGNPVVAFVGKDIGKGGMGTVAEVAYLDDNGVLRHAVIKRPHPETKNYFADEVEAQLLVKEWGEQDNILMPLKVADDYIIYETGERAMDLWGVRDSFNGAQYFSDMLAVTDGLIYFHDKGYCHGDLKGANVLAYYVRGPDGEMKRVVKIIDNSPIELDSNKITDLDYPHTPKYALDERDVGMAKMELEEKGKSESEQKEWIGRAQDSFAKGQMWLDGFDNFTEQIPGLNDSDRALVRKYVEDVDTARTFDDPLPNIANYQTSNPVVARMLTMVSDSFDPMRSGAPNFQHRMRVAELDFVRMVNPNASSADVSTLNREGADALAETAPLPLVGQKLAESMDDGTVLPGDATNVEVPKPKQPPSLPGDPTAVEGRKGKQPPS